MHKEDDLISEAYLSIYEKKEERVEKPFDEFIEKRSAGAAKLGKAARDKGGFSMLTAFHFEAKAKPYKDADKWADKEDKAKHFKEKYKEAYAKLKNIDNLSQKEFQALSGILEVYGEVYIKSTKQ